MEHLKPIFISGKITNLRPFSKDDLPIITRWINDPRVRDFIGHFLPQTEKQEEDWFEKLGSEPTKYPSNVVVAIETKKGDLIGSMGIHNIDWRSRFVNTGAIIGEKACWGKGYGTDAKLYLLEYIFNTLNMHRVGSEVIQYNKRSLNYSLRCGYKLEGVRRRHVFRKGRYWDLYVLGIFREEWEKVWKKYKKSGKVR